MFPLLPNIELNALFPFLPAAADVLEIVNVFS